MLYIYMYMDIAFNRTLDSLQLIFVIKKPNKDIIYVTLGNVSAHLISYTSKYLRRFQYFN